MPSTLPFAHVSCRAGDTPFPPTSSSSGMTEPAIEVIDSFGGMDGTGDLDAVVGAAENLAAKDVNDALFAWEEPLAEYHWEAPARQQFVGSSLAPIEPEPQPHPDAETSMMGWTALLTRSNLGRAAATVFALAVANAVLSTPEARRKVLRILALPRWILRKLRRRLAWVLALVGIDASAWVGRFLGWLGLPGLAEDGFFIDEAPPPQSDRRRKKATRRGRSLTSRSGGRRRLADVARSLMGRPRQAAEEVGGIQFTRRSSVAAPSFNNEDQPRNPGRLMNPGRLAETAAAAATSLCTGLVLPSSSDGPFDDDEEETDHDRFARAWPKIRSSPYGHLVLPPECRFVNPGGMRRGGLLGGDDRVVGGEGADGEPYDKVPLLVSTSTAGWVWLFLRNVLLRTKPWVVAASEYDYVAYLLDLSLRSMACVRRVRDWLRGRDPVYEGMADDGSDDEDADDQSIGNLISSKGRRAHNFASGQQGTSLLPHPHRSIKNPNMATVFQLEFTVEHIGRMVAESKRWIRWIWEEGPSGRNRDLVLTWSVSSGKQEITLDGSPVAFQQQPGRSVVDVRIERKGAAALGPSLHVVCADVIPNGCSPDSFAQYELLIDDVPYRCHPAHPRGAAVQERYVGGGGDSGMPPGSILDILYPGKYDRLVADQGGLEPASSTEWADARNRQTPTPGGARNRERFFSADPFPSGDTQEEKKESLEHASPELLGKEAPELGEEPFGTPGGDLDHDLHAIAESPRLPAQDVAEPLAAVTEEIGGSRNFILDQPGGRKKRSAEDRADSSGGSSVEPQPHSSDSARREMLHSRSTPTLSNKTRGSVDEFELRSPPSDPDPQYPPLTFFDTEESVEQQRRLARDIPLPMPNRNGYILDDDLMPNSQWMPLLVFVNSRSGPQQGQLIIQQLRRLLNPIQIWDLADGDPATVLESFLVLSKLRILVCGGDGTVSWIVSTLEKMNLDRRWPPIAILPLGTGNDLARIHGWGGGYNNESILKILQQITEAYVSLLDRWELTIVNQNGKRKKTKNFMNYMGVGADAQTALGVHMLRENRPKLFFSRAVNKAWYLISGAEDAIMSSCAGLPDDMTLIADGIEVPLPADSQGIILLNIDSYAGGVPLWSHGQRPQKTRIRRHSDGDLLRLRGDGSEENDEFNTEDFAKELDNEERRSKVTACDMPSSCQDGLLDIISVRGLFHLGQIKLGLANAQLLCQCREVTIKTRKKLPIQIDGEPWKQNPCTIRVRRKKDTAIMLHRATEEGGGVETEVSNLLDWAEERHIIDKNAHATLMREFSRQVESKKRQRSVTSQDSIFNTMKRGIGGTTSPM